MLAVYLALQDRYKHQHIKEQVFNTFIESVMELISKLNLNRESIGTDGDTNQSSTDTNQYVSDLVLIMF